MTNTATINNNNPPTTDKCCLSQPSKRRVKSDTPHQQGGGSATTRTGSTWFPRRSIPPTRTCPSSSSGTSSTIASTAPGDVYPAGLVTSAPTLGKLGELLGIGATQLEATAATFSEHAARGEDPEFGRGTVEFVNRFSGDPSHTPSPVLGPITEPPFHGLRLMFLGTAIGSSGVRIDGDGHVLDNAGSLIPGLYAVGSCAATTTFGSGYNSGMALSRGLTLAYLVAQELAGPRP